MDEILIGTFRTMRSIRRCSVDDILCDPVLRQEFLNTTRHSLGNNRPERELLKRLTNLRKKSKLPRKDEEGSFAS